MCPESTLLYRPDPEAVRKRASIGSASSIVERFLAVTVELETDFFQNGFTRTQNTHLGGSGLGLGNRIRKTNHSIHTRVECREKRAFQDRSHAPMTPWCLSSAPHTVCLLRPSRDQLVRVFVHYGDWDFLAITTATRSA